MSLSRYPQHSPYGSFKILGTKEQVTVQTFVGFLVCGMMGKFRYEKYISKRRN